jgi:hypothetical protein
VVFDESLFPFTKLHPIAGAKLQSEILLLPSSLSFMDSGVNIMDNPDANFPNYHHKFAVPNSVQVAKLGATENKDDSAAEAHQSHGVQRGSSDRANPCLCCAPWHGPRICTCGISCHPIDSDPICPWAIIGMRQCQAGYTSGLGWSYGIFYGYAGSY